MSTGGYLTQPVMKTGSFLAALFVFSGAAASSHASFLDRLIGNSDVQVVTDSTVLVPENEIPRPAPGKPVYYLAIAAGFNSFGASMAGEKIPDQKEVQKLMTKTLESQGYKLATNKNPPTLIIAYTWGTLYGTRYPSLYLSGYDVKPDRGRIFAFLGGAKLMRGGQTIDPYALSAAPLGLYGESSDARQFWDMAEDGYYVVKICAYDIQEASNLKAKELWTTRLCASHRGLWLTEAIPLVLSIGGANIGKHTDKPVLVYASEHYKPSVEIGDLKTVEEEAR
jgi:hypothetical protein